MEYSKIQGMIESALYCCEGNILAPISFCRQEMMNERDIHFGLIRGDEIITLCCCYDLHACKFVHLGDNDCSFLIHCHGLQDW